MLVVRERRAAVPPPPLHGVSGMGATGQENETEGVWVKAPLGQVAMEGEGNLDFLRDTRAGCIMIVTARSRMRMRGGP